jgi:hypothetical protein
MQAITDSYAVEATPFERQWSFICRPQFWAGGGALLLSFLQ